jgi:hypothetical protein
MPTELDGKAKEKLKNLVVKACQQDEALRLQYEIGDKFRFIRDRLHALSEHVEKSLSFITIERTVTDYQLAEDEILIYVYLYNTQGRIIQTWQKMLNPGAFYEYSVNRPVYTEKQKLEEFIRSKKTEKMQYGYLTIALKKHDLININHSTDQLGNALAKIREGSLHFNKMISLTLAEQAYVITHTGELIKKI